MSVAVVGQLLVLLALLVGISWCGRLLLPAVRQLGVRLRLSEFTVAFVILGAATSLPELSVALNSTLHNAPQLSFGNLLGATIVLLSLLAGLSAALEGSVSFSKSLSNVQLWLASVVLLAPVLLVMDSRLSRLDGVILMGLYVAYLLFLALQKPQVEEKKQPPAEAWWRVGGRLLLGLGGLYLCAHWTVELSLSLAGGLAVPPLLLGALLLGVGTNLPELATALRPRGDGAGLALGHLLGSAGANTFIVGLLGFISPFTLSGTGALVVTGVSLLAALVLFNIALRTDNRLSRREGIVLLSLYLLFVLFHLFGSRWWM